MSNQLMHRDGGSRPFTQRGVLVQRRWLNRGLVRAKLPVSRVQMHLFCGERPGSTLSGHAEPSTPKKQHRKAVSLSGVRPFVLYTMRHTFLTRLGQSGCDAWTLTRIAGHSSISISQRYVHPSENAVLNTNAVLNAMERLSWHNTGHSAEYNLTGEMPVLAASGVPTKS